jgi:hypothetical protein
VLRRLLTILFACHHFERRGWFRVLGFGLHWKDVRRHAPLFSERNGLTWHLRIGWLSLGLLWPDGTWRYFTLRRP